MKKLHQILAIPIAIGAGLGTVLGIATGDTGIWFGIGAGIGLVFGLALRRTLTSGER